MNKKCIRLNKHLILESIQSVSKSPMAFNQQLKREQNKLNQGMIKDKTASISDKVNYSPEWNLGNSGTLPNYTMQALAMKAKLNIK